MFGAEIKQRREKRAVSLNELSEITRIDKGLLSKIENGSRRPSRDQVRTLAEALDLSDEVLLSEAGILPPDVKDALDSVASLVTASARQAVEPAIEAPIMPSERMSRILADSVGRPAKKSAAPSMGDINGKKTSSAYRAHSYHTKIPPETIAPLIEHFTEPGDVILDPFCGSGMTGVAARSTGRHALLSDLSPAAIHISSNYVTPCSPQALSQAVNELRQLLRPTMSWLYEIDGPGIQKQRTEYVTWSDTFSCPHCDEEWVFWEVARGNDGGIVGKNFVCPGCGESISKRDCQWTGERPVEVCLSLVGAKKRLVRTPEPADLALISEADRKNIPYWLPVTEFGEWREMWRSSHTAMGITQARDFYSKRNLHALAALRHAILQYTDERLRNGLMFAFTAMANRASKRYQWNKKRPTNVMSGTLYISSLRYEWNVWRLFERKCRDIAKYYEDLDKSTDLLNQDPVVVDTILSDATNLKHVPDESIDFVFMDPPFGSNIFYGDVSLLWEAWLGSETNLASELVVNKHVRTERGGKDIADYQRLMTEAFTEVSRVLKSGARAVLVFSNTDDKVWNGIQKAIDDSGLSVEATRLLNKGQRSIKGVQADLGRQQATRLDLVLTLTRRSKLKSAMGTGELDLRTLVREVFQSAAKTELPIDRIYSRVVEMILLRGTNVAGVSLKSVHKICEEIGLENAHGGWTIQPEREFQKVESPYGCLVEEYIGEPTSLLVGNQRHARRVKEPLTEAVPGSRSTALYNAHSYMTKIPPEAIQPFIEHFTRPNDVILDLFSGTGMTGVAAAMCGRRAILRDISVVATHLAYNHTRPCNPEDLVATFSELYTELRPEFEQIYRVPSKLGEGYAKYTLWSDRFTCPVCVETFTLYDAIDTVTGRVGSTIECPQCGSELKRSRLKSIGSEPVLVKFQPASGGGSQERVPTVEDLEHISSFSRDMIDDWFPRVPFGPDRDMFNVSALHLRGISEVADFYTNRNLFALARLLSRISAIKDARIRQVLTFGFTNTAWHGTRMRRFNARGGQRPLTGTLYIPQISSEVNVLEVLRNKVAQLAKYYAVYPSVLSTDAPVVTLGSAEQLRGIPDESIDYVFTDPPFGSNIFYADCNLVTESWLGGLTRVENEAVVNRTLSPESGGKSLGDYGQLLTRSLAEAHRVLKPKGWMTLVFHSTDSRVWGTIQAAAESAGFELVGAGSLDRQQMSHKGYKGRIGIEKVAHFDVVMSLRKRAKNRRPSRSVPPAGYIEDKINELVLNSPTVGKSQWVHSALIQSLVADNYDLNCVSFTEVQTFVEAAGKN